MTQPRRPPIRSVLQDNAGHGGEPLVPRTVFAIAVKVGSLEPSVARPLNRVLTHPNPTPCHRILHLHKPAAPTRSGSDQRPAPYNPHNELWGAV